MFKLIMWVCLMIVMSIVLVFGLAFLKLQTGIKWIPVISYTTAAIVVVTFDWTRRVVMD